MQIKRFKITANLKEVTQTIGPSHKASVITGTPNYTVPQLEALEHYHAKGLDPEVHPGLLALKMPENLRKVGSKLYATCLINYNTLYEVLTSHQTVAFSGVTRFCKKINNAKDPVVEHRPFVPEGSGTNNCCEVLLGHRFGPKSQIIDLDGFYGSKQAQLAIKNLERHIKTEQVKDFGTQFGFEGAVLHKESPDRDVLVKHLKIDRDSIVAIYHPLKRRWVSVPKTLTIAKLRELQSVRG